MSRSDRSEATKRELAHCFPQIRVERRQGQRQQEEDVKCGTGERQNLGPLDEMKVGLVDESDAPSDFPSVEARPVVPRCPSLRVLSRDKHPTVSRTDASVTLDTKAI